MPNTKSWKIPDFDIEIPSSGIDLVIGVITLHLAWLSLISFLSIPEHTRWNTRRRDDVFLLMARASPWPWLSVRYDGQWL